MDGLAVQRLVAEWRENYVGARIDKIHQPADRSIILTLRSAGGNARLLLSAHRTFARAHTMLHTKIENPLQPPMFCMVLRKRLETGRIIEIRQPGMERIIQIWIESRDEKGDLVRYALIAEMMGKHSNIILVQSREDGELKIVDSIVHVGYDLSRVRQILPGLLYAVPPAQDKKSIEELTTEDVSEVVDMNPKDGTRHLLRLAAGIGPTTAAEVLARVQAASNTPSADELLRQLRKLADAAAKGTELPSIGLDTIGKMTACAPFKLTGWPSCETVAPFSEALERFYAEYAAEAAKSQRQHDLARAIADALDRLRGKRARLNGEFERGQDHERDRIQGELLTAYAWQIDKGQTEAVLPNFYDDDAPLAIQLDPAKTAIENAQTYFRRASKRKRATETLQASIGETEEDIRYLEQCLYLLEHGEAMELDELRSELALQGFVKAVRKRPGKGPVKNIRPSGPEMYVSRDGWTIRVGRNNQQNDRLTFRQSRPDDLWFHVKDQPGSHVVIERTAEVVPDGTIEDAAILAAFFSKGRDSANVAVDFTEIKNVWKPNGGRPGLALYKGQKTLYATPDRQLIADLQARSPASDKSDNGQPSNSSSRRS